MDLSSAIGRMLITILAAFGKMERNLITERTRMAIQHLKANGLISKSAEFSKEKFVELIVQVLFRHGLFRPY